MIMKIGLAALIALLQVHAAAAEGPIVNVKIGDSAVSYRGRTSTSNSVAIEHFQNIKYGQDPSGERRFSPPELFVPPNGAEIDATTPGPACPQPSEASPPVFVETTHMSEDCLNLQISRPAGTEKDAKLPVVVHVNGGGVVKGWASDPHYDPEKMLQLSVEVGKPIIFVGFEYRLGIFGFARLPNLKDAKSLNVGLRDQRSAIQWVKDHIEAFGGDPDKITAFGTSSGGTTTSLQLMSYGGEKGVPFTQAWSMSGPPGTAIDMDSDATEGHTRAVAEKLGCGKEGDEVVLKCLREASTADLLSTSVEYARANFPPMGLFTFIPSVDGDYFPDRQSTLYKTGKFVKSIPMVFGWAQDDGAMNAGPAQLVQKEEDMIAPIQRFAKRLTTSDFTELFSHYPVSDFEQTVANYEAHKEATDPEVSVHFFRVARIIRDLLFTCSAIDFSYETNKQAKPSFAGTRLYSMNQTMLTPLLKMGGMSYAGAIHGSDSNYIFNGVFLEGPISEEDQKLSRQFSSAFIDFAHTGNPTGGEAKDEESWPLAHGTSSIEGDDQIDRLNIQVVGGPFEGAVHLKKSKSQAEEGSEQQILAEGESYEFEAMLSPQAQQRQSLLESEKLFGRCNFINSLADKLGH